MCTGAGSPALGTGHPAGQVTNRVTTVPHTARLQRTLADGLNRSGPGCLQFGDLSYQLVPKLTVEAMIERHARQA